MHRLGTYALILGALLTVLGLLLGFGFLLSGNEALAKRFLPVIPIGFLSAFVGVVMTLLGEPDRHD